MAWEPVEVWPEDVPADAFRSATEPVLASRGKRTSSERRTDALVASDISPVKDMVERIALTERHVVVERGDGRLERALLRHITGYATERGRTTYAVKEGADFTLSDRDDCRAQRFLAERLGPKVEAIKTSNLFFGMIPSILFCQLALFLPIEAQHADIPLLEPMRLVYGVLSFVLAFLIPTRTLVNGVGVHRSRGILPWLRWTAPLDSVDRFQALGNIVQVCFHEPRRFASLMRYRALPLMQRKSPAESRELTKQLDAILSRARRQRS